MTKKIPFAKPDITQREISAVTRVIKSGWLTMADETATFEKEFARYVGAKHAIAVNSCTSGLFMSLKSQGVEPGDEVIVPSFTFASCANVVVHCGATPVFVDVLPDSFTIDPDDVYRKTSPKTKAVMPVHYGGNYAATNFNITTIEDSAHKITKNYNSKNMVCYSFYATKNLTTGEGGMITCEDDRVAEWLAKARLHGLSHDAWKRYLPGNKWHYEIEFAGYKTNTIDMLSAMGRVQLSRLDKMEEQRRKIVAYYNKLLGLTNKGTHLYPILVEKRDEFMDYMKDCGIGCSFHFLPLHQTPAYKAYKTPGLPVTEFIGYKVVTLPLYSTLSFKDIEYVCQKVLQFGKFKKDQFNLSVLK